MMKTLNLAGTQSHTTIILGITILVVVAVIDLTIHHHAMNKNEVTAQDTTAAPIPQVVVTGRRMTEAEKLNFDLAPEEIARVEIIGTRLTSSD